MYNVCFSATYGKSYHAVVLYNKSSVYKHVMMRRLIEELETNRGMNLWIPDRDYTGSPVLIDQEITRITKQWYELHVQSCTRYYLCNMCTLSM